MNNRACAIVLSGDKFMFMKQMVHGRLCRVFVGGRIEEGESAEEAVLRELREEANVAGEILYGPVMIHTQYHVEHIFIVDIGNQSPTLGYDPELHMGTQVLKGIAWVDSTKEREVFNEYDMRYVSAVLDDATQNHISGVWLDKLRTASLS